MNKHDLTWIATVFDCEGCISSQKAQYVKKNGDVSNYEQIVIQIGHCSLDLITRFHTLVGMGKLYGHNYNYSYRNKTERKQVYWWKITNRAQVQEFIELIWNEWLSEYRRETIISLGVAPMAKHPHRLMLMQKKTWRCTLPGCRYFIHLGLAHTLPGQQSICWGCSEEFALDDAALKDDQPMCDNCRAKGEGRMSSDDIGDIIEAKLALAKAGVKKVSELDSQRLRTMIAIGAIKESAVKKLRELETEEVIQEPDQIEVIEADEEHAPDCEYYNGLDCTCK